MTNNGFGGGRYGCPVEEGDLLLEPYAAELKQRREAAGMTQVELGRAICKSPSLIAHWESGRRKPSLEDARLLDQVLNTGGTFERFLERNPYAGHFDRAAEAERSAIGVQEYSPAYVPGLLQTEAYARAVFLGRAPLQEEEKLETDVLNRLSSASILTTRQAEGWFVISEAVLRLSVGGPQVMAEQLDHISAMTRQRMALVQVVPFAHGAEGLLGGLVTVMRFADAPDVAYAEGVSTGNYMDDPTLVRHVQDAYDLARAAALTPAASMELIRTIAEEHRGHYARTHRPEQRALAQVQLQRGE
ncbi:helix-turn-helix transcriptional regulator [Streptomyces sp. JJ66]|uniref:helix-turn-helix domain-containing protein n=1 Tax=Streptomyces sp. JJ66 TaxID=2803843 RepID=UPI001C580BA1|nr:helix-turn-helix transcriptional regulator [Streptomyces sp. JJ66]MBW1601900.1 helix-turn-helix transcriptional regulator [Streptomyces sp. JJ66]